MNGTSPHVQRERQLLGPEAPLSMERSPDSASAGPHVLSPVRQDDLPHRTSLLTARPGGPETTVTCVIITLLK